MLTIAQHISLMEHAAGAAPDSRHNLYATFNRAGRRLVQEDRWAFRLTGPVALEPDTASNRVRVPDDFGIIEHLAAAGYPDQVRFASPAEVARLIAAYPGQGPLGSCWTVASSPIETVDQAGHTARFLLAHPLPDSSRFRLLYWRTWRDIMESGAAADRTPEIPAEFEQALIMLARAYTLDLQDQADSLEMARYREELARLRSLEAARIPDGGMLRSQVSRRSLPRNRDIAFTPNL
jgi:hypothetical protein